MRITIEVVTESEDRYQPIDCATEKWEMRVKNKPSDYDGCCRYIINDTKEDANIVAFFDRKTRDDCMDWLNLKIKRR